MSRSETNPEAVVRAFYQEWDTVGFRQSYKNHMRDDVVVEIPGTTFTSLQQWLDADDAYNATYDRPYGRVDLRSIAVAGNKVLTEREEVCYNRDTGDEFTGFKTMSTFEVDPQGRITRWADFFDPTPYQPGGSAMPKRKA